MLNSHLLDLQDVWRTSANYGTGENQKHVGGGMCKIDKDF